MPCNPTEVERDGGYEVVVSAFTPTTPPNGRYLVYVGPLGTSSDPQGWGVYDEAGQARGETLRIVTVVDGVCTIVVPELPVGTGYTVTIVGDTTDARTTGVTATASTLDVRNKIHKSKRFDYRSNLLPTWATGPRRVEEEPLQ